jgi:NADH-quinone oxidoreductase subunit I
MSWPEQIRSPVVARGGEPAETVDTGAIGGGRMYAVKAYFRNIYQAMSTILIGMRITLQYCFAKTVTVQYPDMPPTLQPRFRGFHYYEIERCSACGNCARACPVDCIYIESSGPRKVDRATGISRGGAMRRYAIDYSKCMFCALCTENCPTECIHMGDIHDVSGFDRQTALVEFTELAKRGLRTPMPLWLQKARLPAWAQARKAEWLKRAEPWREEMLKALTEQPVAKKPAPAAETPAANTPAAPAASASAVPPAASTPPPANQP